MNNTKEPVEFSWVQWQKGDGTRPNKKETKPQDATSSLPTICSSSTGSIATSSDNPDSDHKSWSTNSGGQSDEATGKFSYKEVLLMNDYATMAATPLQDPKRMGTIKEGVPSSSSNNNQVEEQI